MSEKSSHLYVTITRVDGPLFDGEAQSVTAPGVDGEFTVLPRHESFISPLRKGTILVRAANADEQTFTVESGTIEVSNNQVTILL